MKRANRATARRWPTLTAGAAAAIMVLSACSGDDSDGSSTGEPTPPGQTTATVEKGTTPPGTRLELGETAVVRYKANPKHNSLLSVSVTKVKRGKLKDLRQFDLDKKARRSSIFYVDTTMRNKGDGDLSRQPIALYGKASATLVVPPVVLGSTFERCNYQPLPEKFTKGKATKLCIVMLVPRHGDISEVQWRPADNSEPISWALR